MFKYPDADWKKIKVTERGGKATGKAKNWLNVSGPWTGLMWRSGRLLMSQIFLEKSLKRSSQAVKVQEE